jgi:tripartite-type tricarboxylate transporter receptor subunit TctC
MGHVRAGKLVALAVTDAKRGTIIPDLPTMIEAGVPNFESVLWFGLAAPRRHATADHRQARAGGQRGAQV